MGPAVRGCSWKKQSANASTTNGPEEVIATGANQLAAACPFCITMLSDGIRDNDGEVAVKDIAEILDEATE